MNQYATYQPSPFGTTGTYGRGGAGMVSGRGGRGGVRGRGGRGGRGGHYSNQPSGPKPIKATEIKAYIYAWCNQFKKKPEYEYETVGTLPKVTYKCKLTVPGFAPTQAEAKSKKVTFL